jgi:hypothetical protein
MKYEAENISPKKKDPAATQTTKKRSKNCVGEAMKQTHGVRLHLQLGQAVKLAPAGGKLLQIEHRHHWKP